MPKENNNSRNTKSQSSKPYDVSNSSFVRRATSRVLDFLPQTSWFSRWLAPTDEEPETSYTPDSLIVGREHGPVHENKTVTRSDLNAVNNAVEPIPPKRAKLHVNSQTFNKPVIPLSTSHETGNEELSPIVAQKEPTSSRSYPRQSAFPSVSVAPVPVNGDDCSESSESTSGCSSLLPQAQSTINRRMSDISSDSRSMLPNTRNMSLSFYRSSAQGRRPTFNLSTFTSSSRSFVHDRGGGSPFYAGKTMYGGASGSTMSNMSSSTRRLGPTVQPTETQNKQVALSSTAKKILDALEQFSTPVLDAKRIPVTIGTKRRAQASSSKRYSELNLPTTTDLLRVKRRERLQKSTSDARQTSVASTYTDTAPDSPPSKTQDVVYKHRGIDDNAYSHQRNVGKLKTRWKSKPEAKGKREEDAIVDVRLPSVELPLKSLPSIDINFPSRSSKTEDNSHFSFSTPVQDKSTSGVASTTPTVNFKFSEPLTLSETDKSVKSDNNSNSQSVVNFNFVGSVKWQNKEVKTKSEKMVNKKNIIKSAAQLETGSVMDVLVNRKDIDKTETGIPDKNKTSEDLWLCEKCNIKNTKDATYCGVCETLKHNKRQEKILVKSHIWTCCHCSKENTSTDKTLCSVCGKSQVSNSSSLGFGDKFKKSFGSWECKACLVNNEPDATRCVACETVKVDTNNKKTAPAIESGFGNKFKPAAGSWECKSCLLVNKAELSACAACTTKNDSASVPTTTTTGFGNLYKTPAGSWECEVCMVRNDSDKNKCVACQTPKPGVEVAETKTPVSNQFSFGIPKGMDDASLGIKFGFKAASQNESNNTPAFSFGMSKLNDASAAVTTVPKATPTFQFGVSNQLQPTSTQTFSFGIPKTEENTNILKNGSDNKSQANVKQPEDNSTQELRTQALKSMLAGSKALDEKPDSLVNCTANTSNTKVSNIFTFGSSATSKTVGKQREKTPVSATASAMSITLPVTAPTSTMSNVLSIVSSKTTTSSSETKNIPTVSQNALLQFNSPNDLKSGLIVRNNESKPNVFSNVFNDTKPSFGGFQPSPFGVSTPLNNNHKVSFDTLTPAVNKAVAVVPFVAPTTPSNIFGPAVTTSSTVATFPAFGAASAPAPAENKPTAVFTFGTSTNKPVEQSTDFGFGTPVANPSSNTEFVFNPVTSPSVRFNVQKTEPKTPMFSTDVRFGSVNTPSASVFGMPQPAASFGEAATASPVFAFGSGTQSQQSANTVFGFGTPQNAAVPSPAPSPAFIFGATPTASPVPAFDPNARPTFNFTGGSQPSTFTATPVIAQAAAANPQRKIRKAVRRQPTRQN